MNRLYTVLHMIMVVSCLRAADMSSDQIVSHSNSQTSDALRLNSFDLAGSAFRPVVVSPMTCMLNRQVSHMTSQLFDLSQDSTPETFRNFCKSVQGFKKRHYAALSKSRLYLQDDDSELHSAVHFNSVVIARLRDIAIDHQYDMGEIPSPLSTDVYEAKLGIGFGENHSSDAETTEDGDFDGRKRVRLVKPVNSGDQIDNENQVSVVAATAVVEETSDSVLDATILIDGEPFKRVESEGNLSDDNQLLPVAQAAVQQPETLKSKVPFRHVKDSNWVHRHKRHHPKSD
jgi:hypothetical protein